MDATTLIQNLIDAIDAIPADLSKVTRGDAIEDAKETASLAKLVLPTIAAPAAAPVGEWFVLNNDAQDLYGPFPDHASGEKYGLANLTPQGVDWHCDRAVPASVVAPGAVQSAVPPTGVVAGTLPQASCPECSATLDANGDCPDPNCVSHHPPAMPSYDATLDDLKANIGRPGSVISNKPSGSLYKQ